MNGITAVTHFMISGYLFRFFVIHQRSFCFGTVHCCSNCNGIFFDGKETIDCLSVHFTHTDAKQHHALISVDVCM